MKNNKIFIWLIVLLLSSIGYYSIMYGYLIQEQLLDNGQAIGAMKQPELIHGILLIIFVLGVLVGLIMTIIQSLRILKKLKKIKD